MDDCEARCVVLRSLFGSCLSDINKNMPLWYYGILLPEEEEDCNLSYLLNLTIDELKSILELCGLTISSRAKRSLSTLWKFLHTYKQKAKYILF